MHLTRTFLMGVIKATVQLYFRNSSDFCGKPFKIILHLWCRTIFIIMCHLCFTKREAEEKNSIISWQWTQIRVITNIPIFAIIPIFNGLSHNSVLCKKLWLTLNPPSICTEAQTVDISYFLFVVIFLSFNFMIIKSIYRFLRTN